MSSHSGWDRDITYGSWLEESYPNLWRLHWVLCILSSSDFLGLSVAYPGPMPFYYVNYLVFVYTATTGDTPFPPSLTKQGQQINKVEKLILQLQRMTKEE